MKVLLKDYKYSENVKIITELVKERNSSLNFINEAFTFAFKNNTTFPYNDTEVPKQLQISNKSSIKSLQNILLLLLMKVTNLKTEKFL